MPNIIELASAIVETKTTAKVRIKNVTVISRGAVYVTLENVDTKELLKPLLIGSEKDFAVSDMLLDIVEKEVIKIAEYAGEQQPDTAMVTP